MIQCKVKCDWVFVGNKNWHPKIAVDFPELPFEVEDVWNNDISHHGDTNILIFPDDMETINQIKSKGYVVEDIEVI